MAEYTVRGECVASYTVSVEADSEEEALEVAKELGCELTDINECYDWQPMDAEFFQN